MEINAIQKTVSFGIRRDLECELREKGERLYIET